MHRSAKKAVLAAVPAGRQALIYLVQWACMANKSTGYIEDQFHAITKNQTAATSADDIVLGTGVGTALRPYVCLVGASVDMLSTRSTKT